MDYAEVEYRSADVSGYVKAPPRQDIVAQTMKRVERGEVSFGTVFFSFLFFHCSLPRGPAGAAVWVVCLERGF